MNFAARNAARLGRLQDLELVVVDWNSDEPLRQVLALTPEAASIACFIEVDKELARAETPEDTAVHPCKAFNVGARRARGRYVAVMPADVLMSQMPMSGLFQLLSGNVPTIFDINRALLMVGAYSLPWQVCECEPDLDEWDRYLQLHTRHLNYYKNYPGLSAGAAMLIFRRELYTKLQGLDETLPYWGWSDIEIGLRVCQYHTTVDLLPFGIFAYDMSQRPLLRQDGIKRYNQHDAVNTRFTVNSENWGLSEHDLPALTMAEQCIQDKKSSLSPHERCRRMLTAVCAKLKSPEPSTVGKNAQNNPDEAALVLLVESAMAANGPRRLLDVGTRRLWPALAAAAVNPTIEIVTCDDWTPRSDMPQGAPHQFSQAFQQVGFVGLLHFLTGDVADMPERLAGIPAADRGFDFMILRLSMLGNRATETSLAFAKHLRPGGIVAITGSQESRQAIASALREMHGLDHLLTLDDVEVLFRK